MSAAWPDLHSWDATRDTLHRWTQVVGKVRLALAPWTNHSWHVPLYVTPRGLTTSAVPHGARLFQIDFDFHAHELVITAERETRRLPLRAQSVAAFTAEVMATLDALDLGVEIHGAPNELADATPFLDDHAHASYDRDAVQAFAESLRHAHRVMSAFRAPFLGKVSPVHFFWGSFDLAVSRFSGRPAPPHPGGIPNLPDWITREAYSHETSSAGFWPGDADHPPLFYSYAVPQPDGFAEAPVEPTAAHYDTTLGEFVLPYDAVRSAPDPDAVLHAFLQTTYTAASTHDVWRGLEVPAPDLARPRRLRPR